MIFGVRNEVNVNRHGMPEIKTTKGERIMARIEFTKFSGIASISGRIGNLMFYVRDGKQYVKCAPKSDQNGVRLDNGSILDR